MRWIIVAVMLLATAPALAFWHGVAPPPPGSYVPTYYFLGF